jgi:hypothetical protein
MRRLQHNKAKLETAQWTQQIFMQGRIGSALYIAIVQRQTCDDFPGVALHRYLDRNTGERAKHFLAFNVAGFVLADGLVHFPVLCGKLRRNRMVVAAGRIGTAPVYPDVKDSVDPALNCRLNWWLGAVDVGAGGAGVGVVYCDGTEEAPVAGASQTSSSYSYFTTVSICESP